MYKVQAYLRSLLGPSLSKRTKLNHLECLVLFYIIEVHNNGRYTALPMSDLYDLFFTISQRAPDARHAYLQEHYRTIDHTKSLWEKFLRQNGSMSVMYNQAVALDSSPVSDLCVRYPSTFIAYTPGKKAINIFLKPQLNSLNSVSYTHLPLPTILLV